MLSPARRNARGLGLPGLAARRTPSVLLFVLLSLLAPALLVAHELHLWGLRPFASPRWNVNLDRSFIEILGYAALLGAIVLLVKVWRRGRQQIYVAWAVALTVLVADDAVELHERGGLWLADHLTLPLLVGLREKDLGQLATWAAMGAVVVALLWATHRRSGGQARTDSRLLGGLILVLMVFAVGVDMLAVSVATLTGSYRLELLLVLLEAGGEVTVMIGLLCFALHIALRRPSRLHATSIRRPPWTGLGAAAVRSARADAGRPGVEGPAEEPNVA